MYTDMLLIKNGTIINPSNEGAQRGDILTGNKKIIKIGTATEVKQFLEENNIGPKDVQEIEAQGMLVAPGLVDVHVHFRDPGFTHKEDIESGARAAAKGGFTTVVLMANTEPCVDNIETLTYILEKGRKTGIHIKTCANVTMGMRGKCLTNMEVLAEAGAIGFTDDGMPILSEEVVRASMEKVAGLGMPISFHEENPAYITDNGVNNGVASTHYGVGGSPRMAEIQMVERDLSLAEGTGAHVSIQHISTKEAVALVREAKKTNPCIHAEATPHHFTLTEDAVVQYGTLAKMNPPLREEADRKAIIEGIQDGTIDMIATDHAPHTKEEKQRELTKAPSGIIGLETALSLGIRELVQRGYLSMNKLIDRMSLGPAQLYHLDAGYLEIGGPADLVVFSEKETWLVDEYKSKSSNSPFTGEKLPGVVYYTICGGAVVYEK